MKFRMIGGRKYVRIPSSPDCEGCAMSGHKSCLLNRTDNPSFCIEANKHYIYKEVPTDANLQEV